MEEFKVTLKAIRVNLNLSAEEMAEKLDVNLDRYYRLESKESAMKGTELIKLHVLSGVPVTSIDI